ncbi:double zinc ribbon domain-containing protein [Methanobrevibacter sp.]|uniref:double zinc ribbon domain-containing protein n=1 Tax=Methanobrevibacter sp. TaxID=66852 RepID=UPI00388E2925
MVGNCMKRVICRRCGKKQEESFKFCRDCGNSLALKACPECGTLQSREFKFCKKCGALLSGKKSDERNFNIFVQEFSGFCKPEMNCTLKVSSYY